MISTDLDIKFKIATIKYQIACVNDEINDLSDD